MRSVTSLRTPLPRAPHPAGQSPLTVLLVEDHPAVAQRLRAVLNWQPGVEVCETVANGHDAVRSVQRLGPDVCLVSAAVGPAAALRLTDRLKRGPQAPRVLLYAEDSDQVTAAAARLVGADGLLARDEDPAVIARMVAETAAGAAPPPVLGAKAPQRLAALAEEPDRPIVAMLTLGIHPDEVARTLGISSRALRSRRQRVLYELDEALAVRRAAARLTTMAGAAGATAPRAVRR